jgi:hypothetical protein
MEFQKDKIKIALAVLAGVAVFAVLVGIFSWVRLSMGKKSSVAENPINQQQTEEPAASVEIQAQLDQLEKQREAEGMTQLPTQEEVSSQLEKLDAMRKEEKIQPPTQEEINAQMENLRQLKNK